MARRKITLPQVYMSRGVLPDDRGSMVQMATAPALMSQREWEDAGKPNWFLEFIGPPLSGNLGRQWATTDDPAYLDLMVMFAAPASAAYVIAGAGTVDPAPMTVPDVGGITDRAMAANAITANRRGRCHGRLCVYHDLTITTRPALPQAVPEFPGTVGPCGELLPPYHGYEGPAVPPDEIPDVGSLWPPELGGESGPTS